MKEDLRDLNGHALFPPRNAETIRVDLGVVESDAYQAVMEYVDTWYTSDAVLARSIYGKRAASSVFAAHETLKRRALALKQSRSGQVEAPAPHGFNDEHFSGADLEDDAAWGQAEDLVVQSRSRDRRAELDAVEGVIARLQTALRSKDEPAKWQLVRRVADAHEIRPRPRGGQLLVFTEFADTARWLLRLFRDAGYESEVLEGSTDQVERDHLQQRFLNGDFQVLVSTDAGGEGIDLQSAHVMVNWDIPWSLVRLEQRMGRLHRIGQTSEVFIYHLVAPKTREGRVQQVMLENMGRASHALGGRIFDLLDATASNVGFDYGAALADAQRSPAASEAAAAMVPDAEQLLARAKEIVQDEDRLKTPTDLDEAQARFARDRLESINPVIVAAFLRQVCATEGWSLGAGPLAGISVISAPSPLPAFFLGEARCLVAADAKAVQKARSEGFAKANEVIVLGPTEAPFQALVAHAARSTDGELFRGGRLVDRASLTSYWLFVYQGEVEHHDGIKKDRQGATFLIRYSGAGAFPVAWESIMNLALTTGGGESPSPAAKVDAEAAAAKALERELEQLRKEKVAWVDKALGDLEAIDIRFKAQIRNLPTEQRQKQLSSFIEHKAARATQLQAVQRVSGVQPRLFGWVQVEGGARASELGRDPNSEKAAITTVVEELERLGYRVDDRQTAGVGYDLFAAKGLEQRLVEVKGFTADLQAVTLEQHEWAQAQQRGADYWLYVVVNCGTNPTVMLRVHDPAAVFSDGPRLIQRFSISVAELRKLLRPL
jgi:hypothetical protein